MKKEVSQSIEMFPYIESWQTSGLTQKAYCDQHNIILHVFYYWLKRYRLKQGPAAEKGFISVSLRTAKSPGAASMEPDWN